MDPWDAATPSPKLKFEPSPTESFLSTPGDMYPPLFGSTTAPTTVSPMDMMSPPASEFKSEFNDAPNEGTPGPDTPAEKKATKKRKSWGQVLPEPKTNLPPRKRAKTEDEKEQRRVERVLRNRRAAQSSRERKRQEVEALEHRNQQLEAMLKTMQQTNMRLLEELQKARRESGVATPLRPNGVTLSQELFSSQDKRPPSEQAASIDDLFASVQSPHTTVNPASLSPALSPVHECEEESPAPTTPAPFRTATSPDATQHPAAMLCPDLPCRSAEVTPWWAATASASQLRQALALLLPLQMLMASTSAMLTLFQRPLMQIAMSLKAGSSLHPAPSILTTILWLVTTPSTSRRRIQTHSSTALTFPSSSPTNADPSGPMPRRPHRPSSPSSLRLALLRKILTCSPTLARPLMDATMAALRLVSTEAREAIRVSGELETAAADGVDSGLPTDSEHGAGLSELGWPEWAAPPSREVLLTLLWALRIEARRRGSPAQQDSSVVAAAAAAPTELERSGLGVDATV